MKKYRGMLNRIARYANQANEAYSGYFLIAESGHADPTKLDELKTDYNDKLGS